MTYIFGDEIQEVPSFEKVVDSLYIRNDVDIYITGSDSYMLSRMRKRRNADRVGRKGYPELERRGGKVNIGKCVKHIEMKCLMW